MSDIEFEDSVPPRMPSQRAIAGTSDSGFTYRAQAIADPLDDTPDQFGPFRGVGAVRVDTAAGVSVTRIQFAQIDDLITLLSEIRDAASAAPDATAAASP